MARRPVLRLPTPTKAVPKRNRPPMETVQAIGAERQGERLGPKFDRLRHTLSGPGNLSELRSDPGNIVPERALVFEVASDMDDFYRAMRGIGLELLDEVEKEREADLDFFQKKDTATDASARKPVPLRLYFTMPDAAALKQLVSVWGIWQRGEELPKGQKGWAAVFAHLSDLRTWGPRDRVTAEALADWDDRLRTNPDDPVRLEVDFWFRRSAEHRSRAAQSFLELVRSFDGEVVRQAQIEPIAYHAALVDVPARHVRQLMAHPDVGLGGHDDVMYLLPQARVSEPFDVEAPPSTATLIVPELTSRPPIAGLLDGMPMAGHSVLKGKLDIDDPDDFAGRYGSVEELRHATAMASLILGGNLDAPTPVKSRLYVRPVMFPITTDFDGRREERMPEDELVVDLIWRSIIRMKEGEGNTAPTAPTVRVVNLSLGNAKQRFARMMSPWARLVDYMAWRYRILFIVSAGNINDPIELPEGTSWAALESSSPEERQRIILDAVLKQGAFRQLLSPAEAPNAITIGSCHDDALAAGAKGSMMVPAYQNRALPNPSSALGHGFSGGIKPELLFPGGREHVRFSGRSSPLEIAPVGPNRYFGLKCAAPGALDRVSYVNGTSTAAALATNATLRIVDALEENAATDEAAASIDAAFYDVILKAMLVHGAQWDAETVAMLKELLNPERKKIPYQHMRAALCRILGYGTPDIDRVLDCTEQRASLLGWGTIRPGESDRFQLPLPGGLENVHGFRAVTCTVGWVTPVNPGHRGYRLAKLEAVPGSDPKFSLGVSRAQCQPTHHAAARGTVFHHRWEGSSAAAFVDDGHLVVDVVCRAPAGTVDDEIPYSTAVTVEVGQDVSVAVYDEIRARLRISQSVGLRVR